MKCGAYFASISPVSFQRNWDFVEYMEHYGNTDAMRDHPQLAGDSWVLRRRLACSQYKDRVVLCAPEDVECTAEHDGSVLCADCKL